MLDMEQSQRRDIDEMMSNTITLEMDTGNTADNPYVVAPTTFIGNNWFTQGTNVVKLNVAEWDSIVFTHNALSRLS